MGYENTEYTQHLARSEDDNDEYGVDIKDLQELKEWKGDVKVHNA